MEFLISASVYVTGQIIMYAVQCSEIVTSFSVWYLRISLPVKLHLGQTDSK